MRDVYVLGLAIHPPADRHDSLRLEELVHLTTKAAIEDAGIARRDVDSVTLGASDELDGRPISSMLMAAPAGAFLTDETRVTDSGASALCLGATRILSGEFDVGLVVSWCKPSEVDVGEVMNARAEPFFTRPLGMDDIMADGLFAQAVVEEFGVDQGELAERVVGAYTRAAANERGLGRNIPDVGQVASSPYEALPMRTAHRAPPSDGAVAMVLAGERWLRRRPDLRPLARIAGLEWASDSYRLDWSRLRELRSARTAWEGALRRAGLASGSDLDVVELETPTVFHEAALVRAFGVEEKALTPSGGAFAQNPLFCSGLVNAAEAVLQVAGGAGNVQRGAVRRAAAHSCHGYAQQGNVVMIFDNREPSHG